MNSVLISHRITLLIIIVGTLCACQDKTEKQHDNLKPGNSHRTVKEKSVVVPVDVIKRWKAVRIAVIDKTRGTENTYSVPVGTLFKVPSSELTILVEYFLPAFTMEGTTITTSSNDLINPGAKVKITESGSSVFQGWLFSRFPSTYAAANPHFGFSLVGVVPAGLKK